MKRQKVRQGILLISFLLLPLTLYYFSPYLIIQGLTEGIITGSFIVFIFMFVISIFFGRVFCGWICPAGGLQECAMTINNSRAKGGKLNYIKFLIWIPWVLTIVMLLLKSNGIKSIDFFYQTENGVSVSSPYGYIIYFAVIALVLILVLTTGKRGFCHYSCWMSPFMIIGMKIGRLLKLPSLKLVAHKERCIGCDNCTKNCVMSLEVQTMVKSESMCNSECILCGKCIDSCPKKVIKYKIQR